MNNRFSSSEIVIITMATLRILLYSIRDTQRWIYNDSDSILTNEIDSTLRYECKVKSLRNHGALIEVCSRTSDALQKLQEKYDVLTRFHIRKLKGFISKLSDGDLFYYFNEEKTSVVERRTAIFCINAMKAGFTWSERIHNEAYSYYSRMNTKFTYLSYGYDGIKECIGEKKESKRVCRFCGKQMPDVTFEKDAHAIQDALGNKLLFCLEECDTCNRDLALTEDNFRYLMDFRRAMYNIPRKDSTKTPNVVGKTFIIKADSCGKPELYLMKESLPEFYNKQQSFMMHLELKNLTNNERMYKALCKMVIDMLPGIELAHFKNTIKWIVSKDEWIPDTLPSAKMAILPPRIFNFQPILDIFINNKCDSDTPYCTAIVWLYDIVYMFVVPFTDVDRGRYKYDQNLESHWKYMSNLIGIQEWYIQNTSEYRLSIPWVKWNIDLNQPNIHVLPKSDQIFEECLEMKLITPDINMPSFTHDEIYLDQINSALFTLHYNKPLSDRELSDLTQHIKGPTFILSPKEDKVCVSINVNVYDTTDQIQFYTFSYKITFFIKRFHEYINIEYNKNGDVTSFAFHYELSKYLLHESFIVAESKLCKQRKGSQFEKCSVDKIGDIDKIMKHIHYHVPNIDEKKYISISDKEIHGIDYSIG